MFKHLLPILFALTFSSSLFAAPKGEHPPPIVVIDPGHGGKDPGALSKFGIREKKLVLSLSKKLAVVLRKKMNAQVFLTRPDDRFITLAHRNRVANQKQCDLFLSLHANAARNPKADGLEIYYLNKATDKASQKLARRENEGAPKPEKELEAIVSDLIQTASTEESSELAGRVQKSFVRHLQKKYDIQDIHVKTALFYVLVGAKCPSLLVETGFITNKKEARRLKSDSYQRALVSALAEGIENYWNDLEKPKGDL